MQYQVVKGQKYRALVKLSGFETWATDEQIAEKFEEAGFSNVQINRLADDTCIAFGIWNGASTATAEIPEQVIYVEEAFDH